MQIPTPQRAKSHLIASNESLQIYFFVICSFADADRLCVFCSRQCHIFEACGSCFEPGYGGGVTRQKYDEKRLQPSALPNTPKPLQDLSAQTTPNIEVMILKILKAHALERKKYMKEEKLRKNNINQDPD